MQKHHPLLERVLERIPFLARLPTHFLFFAILGGIATLVDWSVFYLTHLHFGWHYLASVTLTFTLGVLITFFGNKYLNFYDSSKAITRQLLLFTCISGGGLIITYGLLVLFIDYAGFHAMVARGTATLIVLFYNYFSQRHITFRQPHHPPERL